MYYISKSEWAKLQREHPDYTGKALRRHEHGGKVCEAGENTCFLCLLPGAPKGAGAVLCFEHIHFEIV